MSNEPRRAGRHFLQIPGPTPVPDRILRAMDMPVIDHRGPGVQEARPERAAPASRPSSRPPTRCLSIPRPAPARGRRRCVNTLSPGDKVLMYETGPLRHAVEDNMAVKLGLEPEFIELRLAQRRRCRGHRGAPARGQGPHHQGRVRGAQRDLDGRHLAYRRGAQGHRCGQAPGAADGRYHLLAGLDRLPARRVGRGRHGRRLAEGPDAAAGPRLQCREREGAGRHQDGQAAQVLFWPGRR